jgi:hypothetical protein
VKRLLVVTIGVVVGVLIAGVAQADRNSGGTFTFTAPGGPVVSAGQTISSAWANGSLTEIQTALTESLSRNGQGGMNSGKQLKLDAGTVGAPGQAFTGRTDTGIYYTAGPTFNVAVGAANALACTTSGCSVPGTFAATADVTFSSAASVAKDLTLSGNLRLVTAGTTTHYTTVKPGAVTTDYDLTLPAAPPAGSAWTTAAYNVGDLVTNDGGKVYICVTAGTALTGPSGTGTGTGTGAVFDYYAADYSQALYMSTAGALSGHVIANVNQAFGTPAYPRDVAIKSYVDTPAASPGTWTTLTVSQTGGSSNCAAGAVAPAYRVFRGVVYVRGIIAYNFSAAATTCTLTALPAGARPGTAGTVFPISGTGVTNATISSAGVFAFPLGGGSSTTYYFSTSFPAEG